MVLIPGRPRNVDDQQCHLGELLRDRTTLACSRAGSTVYVKHLGADMRLHRARQLLGQFEAIERTYLGSTHLGVESCQDPAGAWYHRVRIHRQPPEALAELVRTAVTATRDALDNLAVSLAVASRNTLRDTTFPIAASAKDYPEEESRSLRHTNLLARAAVRSVTPWQRGDDLLWELHVLASLEQLPSVRLGAVVAPIRSPVPVVLQVLQPDAAGAHGTGERCRPVDDGTRLGTGTVEAGTTPYEAGVRLVLASGTSLRGRPASAGLDMLLTHVGEVVESVVRAAEQR